MDYCIFKSIKAVGFFYFWRMHPDLPYYIALSMVDLVGPVTARKLITHCGGVRKVFETSFEDLVGVVGVGGKIAGAIHSSRTLQKAEKEYDFCEKEGIDILCFLDEEYPENLREAYDSPLVLYKKGRLKLSETPAIAIVGTRKPTAYGRDICRKFAGWFADQGINVVSGLAYGIDIEAHRAALNAGGMTTAVLAHGLDQVYPKKHEGDTKKIALSGALVSEYPSGTKLDPGNFPARNRIISGLCKAVVVVEAAASGGALITAKFAFDQDREVFAIPGSLGQRASEGCNALIRDNVAKLVTCPEEVFAELSLIYDALKTTRQIPVAIRTGEGQEITANSHEKGISPSLTGKEATTLSVLEDGSIGIDDLSKKTAIPSGELIALLLELEFKGLVRQEPGKRFGLV